jgi:hypothetical protein
VAATARNSAQHLNARQERAVDLLAEGMRIGEVAQAVGCDRVTLWRWSQEPGFVAALNQRRQDLWHATSDRLRSLLPRAFDVIDEALAAGDSRSALGLLKLAGVGHIELGRVGPTEAAVIVDAKERERVRQEQEQAEAEVRAAEREADLERRRLFAEMWPR